MSGRHLVPSFGLIFLIYLCVNYTWSHAALAGAISGEGCQADLFEQAEGSVADLFGEVTAHPWVYCLNRPVAGLSVEYGTTRFAPLFPPIIILGPRGQNPDVASHEFVHAELAQRTGVLLRSYRIPTWFDEGLAMQVDTRAAYDRNALGAMIGKFSSVPLRLKALSVPSEFFGHGEKSMMHYAFSKCVLKAAIEGMGIEKVRNIASGVEWASDFPTNAFLPFEEHCRRL